MTTTTQPIVASLVRSPLGGIRERARDLLPRLVLAPSFLLILIFVDGFNLWTLLLRFTTQAFTNLNFIGWANDQKLWDWTFQRICAVESVHRNCQHGAVRAAFMRSSRWRCSPFRRRSSSMIRFAVKESGG